MNQDCGPTGGNLELGKTLYPATLICKHTFIEPQIRR